MAIFLIMFPCPTSLVYMLLMYTLRRRFPETKMTQSVYEAWI
jgi:hypothetical protein